MMMQFLNMMMKAMIFQTGKDKTKRKEESNKVAQMKKLKLNQKEALLKLPKILLIFSAFQNTMMMMTMTIGKIIQMMIMMIQNHLLRHLVADPSLLKEGNDLLLSKRYWMKMTQMKKPRLKKQTI